MKPFDEDIFDIMDRVFGDKFHTHTYVAGQNKEERIIDKDNIYYTFELNELHKEDILVEPMDRAIDLSISRYGKITHHTMDTPYLIKPKEVKVTFKNGILDIICPIDKEKSNITEIED